MRSAVPTTCATPSLDSCSTCYKIVNRSLTGVIRFHHWYIFQTTIEETVPWAIGSVVEGLGRGYRSHTSTTKILIQSILQILSIIHECPTHHPKFATCSTEWRVPQESCTKGVEAWRFVGTYFIMKWMAIRSFSVLPNKQVKLLFMVCRCLPL